MLETFLKNISSTGEKNNSKNFSAFMWVFFFFLMYARKAESETDLK